MKSSVVGAALIFALVVSAFVLSGKPGRVVLAMIAAVIFILVAGFLTRPRN